MHCIEFKSAYVDRLPYSAVYKFAELDSADNIVFEEREKSSGVPLIKVKDRKIKSFCFVSMRKKQFSMPFLESTENEYLVGHPKWLICVSNSRQKA